MEGTKITVQSAQVFVEKLLTERLSPDFVYHNLDHTREVVENVKKLSKESGLNDLDAEIVELAAWFHDCGYIYGFENHEKKSSEIALNFLSENEYPKKHLDHVLECIRSTKMPQSPKDLLGEILCDADLSGLGSDSYFERSALMRKEWQLGGTKKFKHNEWIKFEIDFLSNHSYFTEAAKKIFNAQKEKNIAKLQGMKEEQVQEANEDKTSQQAVKSKKKKNKNKNKKIKYPNEPTRGIETMFRTATRTHINLSSIADNKANIMLSINALIISIVLSTLLPKLDNNPFLIIPSIALLGTCLLAIIFATLSTRPKITGGKFSKQDIEQKRSNLLFFGNFYNMEVKDYEAGMNEMMKDKDFLYGSLIRDLYYLGVVLAKKYKYLRICYTVFMFGLILSVLAFGISFWLFAK